MNRGAAIDIGTNSVKLLVGELGADGTVVPIWETSEQTRLGAGFYSTGRLKPAAIARTVAAVSRLAGLARTHGAEQLVAVATSAVREAANGMRLRDALKAAAGLGVRVLTGEEEAEWTFQGVASEPRLRQGALLVVDVGGGSTELVWGQGRTTELRCSLELGTVRLLERRAMFDPPSPEEWVLCWSEIRRTLAETIPSQVRLRIRETSGAGVRVVGAGGTATILARLERRVDRYDRERLAGTVLSVKRLRAMRRELWSLGLSDRRRLAGMPTDRADVMLTGVALYEGVLATLGIGELYISLRGLRFGVLLNSGLRDFDGAAS